MLSELRSARWMGRRHGLWQEALLLIGTYLAYDAGRGIAGGGRNAAIHNGRSVASAERHLGLYMERPIQRAAGDVPGLLGVFGFGYATFHIGVTVLVLLWLFRYHPEAYPRLRTSVMVATGLALVGFTLFPVAPPRLDGIGIADTLSLGRTTTDSGLLRFLYNPYAAMPSVHVAFATLVGLSLVRYSRSRWVALAGWVYPVFVTVEVMATGNHFLLDVVAGAFTGLSAFGISSVWLRQPRRVGGRRQGVELVVPTPIRTPTLVDDREEVRAS